MKNVTKGDDMRKIIVVEDNDADAKQLQSYIKTFGEEAKENFSVGELGIISGSFFYVREKTGIVENFDFKKEKNCNESKEELQLTFT